MTDIKKLLADASPTPWTMQVNEPSSLVSAYDADGEPLDLLFDERVAALALYAVNRLERYEALREAAKDKLDRQQFTNTDDPLYKAVAALENNDE